MALLYWDKSRWLEAQLDGVLNRGTVFLCCPGPSLKEVGGHDLRGPGRTIAALNTAYPAIRPDIWIGMDPPSCFDRRLWWESFIKVGHWNWSEDQVLGRPIKTGPMAFFTEVEDRGHPNEMLRHLSGKLVTRWCENSFEGALHILLWMGATRIALVGCDFGGKSDYHDERVLCEDFRVDNRFLYSRLVKELNVLTLEAEGIGIDFISCTPNSPVNDFLEFVPLAQALEKSWNTAPRDATAPVLHVREAEMARWSPAAPKRGRQVIVASDDAQEWLLPWWWKHYSRHNSYPVLFVDLGMSDSGKAFCKAHGSLASIERQPWKAPLDYWYLKPFAILKGTHSELLWVDLDCQALGDLGPLFDASAGAKIGIQGPMNTKPESRLPRETSHYNTCVISVRHGEPAIQSWAERMFAWKRQGGYTDEPPMGLELSTNYAARVNSFQPHVIAFVTSDEFDIQETTSHTLVQHWVGPRGKKAIRDFIEGRAQEPASAPVNAKASVKRISFCTYVRNRSRATIDGREHLWLPKAVESIVASVPEGVEAEIVVADWHSTDWPLADWIEKAAGKIPVKIVPMTTAFSSGRGRNAAARAATGDLIYFLDADIVLSPPVVRAAIDSAERGRASCPIPLVFDKPDAVEGFFSHPSKAIIAMPRCVYEQTDGFPERDAPGYDDTEFFDAVAGIVPVDRPKDGSCYHIWHPTQFGWAKP